MGSRIVVESRASIQPAALGRWIGWRSVSLVSRRRGTRRSTRPSGKRATGGNAAPRSISRPAERTSTLQDHSDRTALDVPCGATTGWENLLGVSATTIRTASFGTGLRSERAQLQLSPALEHPLLFRELPHTPASWSVSNAQCSD